MRVRRVSPKCSEWSPNPSFRQRWVGMEEVGGSAHVTIIRLKDTTQQRPPHKPCRGRSCTALASRHSLHPPTKEITERVPQHVKQGRGNRHRLQEGTWLTKGKDGRGSTGEVAEIARLLRSVRLTSSRSATDIAPTQDGDETLNFFSSFSQV